MFIFRAILVGSVSVIVSWAVGKETGFTFRNNKLLGHFKSIGVYSDMIDLFDIIFSFTFWLGS